MLSVGPIFIAFNFRNCSTSDNQQAEYAVFHIHKIVLEQVGETEFKSLRTLINLQTLVYRQNASKQAVPQARCSR